MYSDFSWIHLYVVLDNIQVKTWRFDNTGGLCIWDCIACNWILEIFLAYFWKKYFTCPQHSMEIWQFSRSIRSYVLNQFEIKKPLTYINRWNPFAISQLISETTPYIWFHVNKISMLGKIFNFHTVLSIDWFAIRYCPFNHFRLIGKWHWSYHKFVILQ